DTNGPSTPGSTAPHADQDKEQDLKDAEVAQQVWSAVHGAVALELKGLVLTPDPEYTYRTFLTTLIRGLAPASGQGCSSGSKPT
ncbi:MAG: TetR-like C-terminal domain-containing protein, partial [Trebonia sp.]